MSASVKKSRAAVEQRNLIVPQMRDYDQLGMQQEWVPHLMYFHPRNARLKSVSTDEFGFRNTTGAKPDAPTALLIGGSSVFGIGATSDATTIPSLLNAQTKYNWRNLGGRAFNSTQEAILLHLANIKKIDGPIVVMSGINNLTRSMMSGNFSPVFGAFFQQMLFEAAMARSRIGKREAVRRFVSNVSRKISKRKSKLSVVEGKSKTSSYLPMLDIFERDCRMIQTVSRANNTNAIFILQPFIPWIDKELTTEESRLFSLLDQESADFTPILKELSGIHLKYRDDISDICKTIGLKFFDANDSAEFKAAEWLFVDRAHFTDRGNLVMSSLIMRYLKS